MPRTDQPTVRAHYDATIVGPRLTWSVTAADEFATLNAGALVLPVGRNALGRQKVVRAAVTLFDQDASDLVYRSIAMLINYLAGVSGRISGHGAYAS